MVAVSLKKKKKKKKKKKNIIFFFFKQKTAYEMCDSDWSSDVCSSDLEIASVIAAGEARLDGHGRLLVRPSGTEPLVRVMVEAEDEALLTAVLDEVSDGLSAAI